MSVILVVERDDVVYNLNRFEAIFVKEVANGEHCLVGRVLGEDSVLVPAGYHPKTTLLNQMSVLAQMVAHEAIAIVTVGRDKKVSYKSAPSPIEELAKSLAALGSPEQPDPPRILKPV